ncbi:MAG TPA: hypothetical protein VF721_00010 [Pyrinomonadaceae bacterium]
MFDLRVPRKGFEDVSREDVLNLLRLKEEEAREDGITFTINTRWKTFYIYFHRHINTTIDSEQISKTLYEKLFNWAREIEALRVFMKDYVNELNKINAQPEIADFDPDNSTHQNLFRNAFICNFSLCQKFFPHQELCFIVGCNPFYDDLKIKLEEVKRRDQISSAQSKNNDEFPGVNVVFRYYSDPVESENGNIQFNAHRFESRYEALPQQETNLFIGTWKNAWAITAGAADHDEIYCPNCREHPQKLHLTELRPAISGGYTYRHVPETFESLPEWMKGVRWAPHAPVNIPLTSVINPRRFKTQFVLIARVFPEHVGQLAEIEENPALKKAFEVVNPIAALKLTDNFWLLRGRDLNFYSFTKSNAAVWTHNIINEKDRFEVNGCDYIWELSSSAALPEGYKGLGLLYIYPSEIEKRSYELQLSLNPEAEFLVANTERTMNESFRHDSLLGRQGAVKLKCKKEIDGRGEFVLLPVKSAQKTYFAIRPVGGVEESWQNEEGWIEFDGTENNKVKINEQGALTYDGEEVIARRYSYHMLCGTSLFQLKVSGTPRVKKVVIEEDQITTAAAAAKTTEIQPIALPPASVPDTQNVVALLQNTSWSTYQAAEKSRSNISVHFDLNEEGKEPLFLKAFFPECRENAEREQRFYRQYRERATELFIQPPEFLYRQDNSLWGMVFPQLKPKNWVFRDLSRASLAQAAAVGYALSLLHKVLSEDRLINFDVDPSVLCFNDEGRICIVDFDNVFPLIDYPLVPEQIIQIGDLAKASELPIKSPVKPPEALKFNLSPNNAEKLIALSEITPAYGVFMIGMTVLELFQAAAKADNGDLIVKQGSLVENAADEEKSIASEFESLLQRTTAAEAAKRPSAEDLVEQFKHLIRQLADSEAARQQMSTLLGESVIDDLLK